MSQYLNFFARIGDNFIPIGDYSRNTVFYQMFNSCIYPPYEKIMPVSIQQLENIRDGFEKNQRNIELQINRIEKKKGLIATFDNSVDDKLEAVRDCDISIGEWQENYDEVLCSIGSCNTYINMIEAIKYSDEKIEGIDFDNYIYCGIEVGLNVTVEDIVRSGNNDGN